MSTAFDRETSGRDSSVGDLSSTPCYIIDKNLDLARGQFAAGSLVGAHYEDFVPSSLGANWNVLAEHYPRMIERWRSAEVRLQTGHPPGVDELANIMYEALGSFVAAAALERYGEMAMCISTAGLAHRVITKTWEFMIERYEDAALYAGWSRDPSSATFFRETAADLRTKHGAS